MQGGQYRGMVSIDRSAASGQLACSCVRYRSRLKRCFIKVVFRFSVLRIHTFYYWHVCVELSTAGRETADTFDGATRGLLRLYSSWLKLLLRVTNITGSLVERNQEMGSLARLSVSLDALTLARLV